MDNPIIGIALSDLKAGDVIAEVALRTLKVTSKNVKLTKEGKEIIKQDILNHCMGR